jgi:hypothetical protein
MNICENCGSQRVENAKFCIECGNKFAIPKEEEHFTEQQKLIKSAYNEQEKFKESIIQNLYQTDVTPLIDQYKQYLKSVKQLISFNEKNAEMIMGNIVDIQDSTEYLNKFYNEISNENYRFAYELDVLIALFLEAERNKDNFNPVAYLEDKIKDKKEFNTNLLNRCRQNEIIHKKSYKLEIKKYINLVDTYKILEELHDKGKLIELIRYRGSFTKGEYPKSEYVPSTKTKIEKDNKYYQTDVLDVLEFALAFTSPVSAAKYIVKKVKEN